MSALLHSTFAGTALHTPRCRGAIRSRPCRPVSLVSHVNLQTVWISVPTAVQLRLLCSLTSSRRRHPSHLLSVRLLFLSPHTAYPSSWVVRLPCPDSPCLDLTRNFIKSGAGCDCVNMSMLSKCSALSSMPHMVHMPAVDAWTCAALPLTHRCQLLIL